MLTRTICNLATGAHVASAGFTDNRNGEIGEWIRETVAELCECDPEAVSEDGEFLTVEGVPVYILC